ncbi:hypothetical protein [Mycolicibacter hiberniae]|uniref:Uncharacterized protein n=1 Tax=Mycolicibacter hiberniae TaxID=29314 RepID=A0A7I7X6M2_9MYCO|nr:hypothetical protein [Mycolicibacter hiberniae]MCV7087461.1 hypothetical protein [Mycolicibacter hiberniae]ORV69039.1 hypothetical protein AWC09_13755 [Mycolicibacter hiberniae]BBZ25020.1 hypothetical protein MHIB_34380 [Mycolicibacter hiberniae]
MTDDFVRHYGEDFLRIALSRPPAAIPPGPVHPGGSSPVDATMAAFGAATNLNLVETNTGLAEDHADRAGHAADAAQKFANHEADAAARFRSVAAEAGPAMAGQGPQESMGGAMQGVTSAMQGITGALGGALGAVGKLPQELMQAGQGALSPLMSAAQSLSKGGLGGATLASDFDADPGLEGGGFGSGGTGGGLGAGTTPASNLGPPPVPGTSAPTTPTGSLRGTTMAGPAGGAPATGGAGGGMMPMMPGGAGAGAKGKEDKTDAKRIAAPGVPNGQPVKGRTTAPPNVPVTKSVAKDVGHPGITPLKRIVDKDDSAT